MVSIGPNSMPGNFSHMWNIPDLRGTLPEKTYNENSLMYIIANTPHFSMFNYIVRLAKFQDILDDPDVKYTMFIPRNQYIRHLDIKDYDISFARDIVRSSIIQNIITTNVLKTSCNTSFPTKNSKNRISISNRENRTYINQIIKLTEDELHATNGKIYEIDCLLF